MIMQKKCDICHIEFSYKLDKRFTRKYCTQKCSKIAQIRPYNPSWIYEKYLSRVIKSDSCWGWSACTNGNGYGSLEYKNKAHTAHRVSWEYHFGEIPKGLWVLHHCDNRICSNPEHLYLGDIKNNTHDAKTRNRFKSFKGEDHAMVKLTESQVHEIRNLLKSNEFSRNQIARKYDISATSIKRIENGKTWKHI